MASNNLRIIYENLVDLATTTITASTAASGAPVANLKSDIKGKVWQATSTTATLTVNFSSAVSVGAVILAFTNLPSTATIAISGGYTASAATCSPWALALQDWGTTPAGSSKYSYGYGTYARIWFTANTSVTSLVITITSSGSNVEVSRLIIGPYWSPIYNTGYGMSNSVEDLSTNQRTESGDLISRRGPRFNTLQFDTQWLDASDRINLRKLFLGNGIYKPIFVSLFPNDTDVTKEAAHQIYGKLDQSPGVSYSSLNIYSTQFNVQEL